jgi:hypothetical protein
VALDDKAQNLVERSRYTNSLHMSLAMVMEQVIEIAEEGIDDNLDRNCVKVFQRALDEAEIIQQSIKSELEGHMNKGKWG